MTSTEKLWFAIGLGITIGLLAVWGPVVFLHIGAIVVRT